VLGARVSSATSEHPRITASRLLKSWATRPPDLPIASMRCAMRNCSSIFFRAVMSYDRGRNQHPFLGGQRSQANFRGKLRAYFFAARTAPIPIPLAARAVPSGSQTTALHARGLGARKQACRSFARSTPCAHSRNMRSASAFACTTLPRSLVIHNARGRRFQKQTVTPSRVPGPAALVPAVLSRPGDRSASCALHGERRIRRSWPPSTWPLMRYRARLPYRGNPQLFILQPGDDYDACLLRYSMIRCKVRSPLSSEVPSPAGSPGSRARREGAHGLFRVDTCLTLKALSRRVIVFSLTRRASPGLSSTSKTWIMSPVIPSPLRCT